MPNAITRHLARFIVRRAEEAEKRAIGYFSDEAAGLFISNEAEKLSEADYKAFHNAKNRMDEFMGWTESMEGERAGWLNVQIPEVKKG